MDTAVAAQRGEYDKSVVGRGEKQLFTAEKSIQQQLRCGSDLLFCLDHCTHPAADPAAQRTSVEHTLRGAERCKAEFDLPPEIPLHVIPNENFFALPMAQALPKDNPFRALTPGNLWELGLTRFGVFPEMTTFGIIFG